jgi:hypothetical protein
MTPLLVSVPSVELNTLKPWGSVFSAKRLTTAALSHSLLQALQVVLDQLGPKHSDVLCVARPEMFTHGPLLDWLGERVHGATTHVSLSNGAAPKALPGMRNELFVYGLHRESAMQQYRALLRRAPELLSAFDVQYNSAHQVQVPGAQRARASEVLVALKPYLYGSLQWFYPLYFNRHSHADSSERMLKWGSADMPALMSYERLVVIDCNETALNDTLYCHGLASYVAQAPNNPGTCLLLVLPDPEDTKSPISDRMAKLHQGLLRGHLALPRVRLDNVQLCTALDEQEFLSLNRSFDLVLHENSAHWTYTSNFYRAASAVHYYQPRHSLCSWEVREGLRKQQLGLEPTLHAWTPKFVARLGLELH